MVKNVKGKKKCKFNKNMEKITSRALKLWQ